MRLRFLILLVAAAVLLLVGCSPLAALNASVPSDGYDLARGQAYGEHSRQQLDVYAPKTGSVPRPVVVYFYGGSWERGSRSEYKFLGEALTSKGFVTVVADYRLYPEVKFPSFLEDGAKAVTWVQENIADFGGDPRSIYLMGHSAGAYNASMLAFDRHYIAAAGGDPRSVRGLVGMAGPYDFLPITSRTLRNVFGDAPDLPATQPVNFVAADSPPALLLTGGKDTVVDPKHTVRLAARMRAAGGRVTEITYPDLGHVTIVGALATPYRNLGPVLDDVARFIRGDAVRTIATGK